MVSASFARAAAGSAHGYVTLNSIYFMSLLDNITETETYKQDYSRAAHGVSFHLPSCRWFIPYSWLLHSELNQNATELQLHYTHAVVTITGTKLYELHNALEDFRLTAVQELAGVVSPKGFPAATVSRIEIAEKTDD